MPRSVSVSCERAAILNALDYRPKHRRGRQVRLPLALSFFLSFFFFALFSSLVPRRRRRCGAPVLPSITFLPHGARRVVAVAKQEIALTRISFSIYLLIYLSLFLSFSTSQKYGLSVLNTGNYDFRPPAGDAFLNDGFDRSAQDNSILILFLSQSYRFFFREATTKRFRSLTSMRSRRVPKIQRSRFDLFF